MEQQPAVSVVMPIYNAEPFLREALDSAVSQTLKNIEIVCVNDGSKDASLQIINEYASKDERIVVLDRPNGGYGKGMNAGINAARGEYIAILEPDDFILPTMYEKLYGIAKKYDLDFVRSDYNRFVTNKNNDRVFTRVKVISDEDKYGRVLNPQEDLSLFNARMENWTGIYKHSFLQNNNIVFNESPGAAFQDNGFWFQTYCWATKIAYYDEAFYCYRTDNPASSINQTDKVFVMLDEYKWIENWLRSHPDLCKKFIGIFQYKKTHNCEFAFSRLAEQFQLPFLERYSSEYRDAFKRNEIDESLFWPDELIRLEEIVSDPRLYLEKYKEGKTDSQQFNTAANKGKVALFRYYVKTQGLGVAIKLALKSIFK